MTPTPDQRKAALEMIESGKLFQSDDNGRFIDKSQVIQTIKAALTAPPQVPEGVALEWLAELVYLREYGHIGAKWSANESKDVWRDKALALLTQGKE